jgi:ribosome-binding factor A
MKARTTPKLKFIFDASIGRGAQMSRLIDEVVAVDREHARERGDSEPGSQVDEGQR